MTYYKGILAINIFLNIEEYNDKDDFVKTYKITSQRCDSICIRQETIR